MKTITFAELNIFLVEPSGTQERIIRSYLLDLGVDIAKISTAQRGHDALERMRTAMPDLVISAMYLPDMNGTDLVEAMHSDKRLQDIAYILISSETNIRMLEPIRQAGAIAILPKPFNKEQLRHALFNTIDFLEPDPLPLEEMGTETLKLLLVDDSQMSRHHIQRLLEGIGIVDVTEAIDGAQALEMVNTEFFDLIITDYNMPKMDGKELTDHIRNDSNQPGVPILMVTSEQDMRRLSAVEQAGVSAICDKPFEAETIRDYIRKIIVQG